MIPFFLAEFVSLIASEAKDVGEHSHIRKDHVVEAIKVGKTSVDDSETETLSRDWPMLSNRAECRTRR